MPLEQLANALYFPMARRVANRDLSYGPTKQETEGGRARFKWLTLGLFGSHDSNSFDDSSVKGKRSRGETQEKSRVQLSVWRVSDR